MRLLIRIEFSEAHLRRGSARICRQKKPRSGNSGAQRNLREIGKQLGVAHLLEGSVQRVGGKVRVNAQLIDARTDGHLWAENYDRPLDDVFAIQSEIAKAIAGQLQAKISPSEKAAIDKAANDKSSSNKEAN